jgi:hypothetical protein
VLRESLPTVAALARRLGRGFDFSDAAALTLRTLCDSLISVNPVTSQFKANVSPVVEIILLCDFHSRLCPAGRLPGLGLRGGKEPVAAYQ